jgi:methylated-DNA-[protein]-cysteine S-methyltransferase
MTLFATEIETRFGTLSVAVNTSGALVATAFGDTRRLSQRLGHARVTFARGERLLRDVREQVAAYSNGRLRTFDLPLAPAGTPFQQAVWAALGRIPYGETRTYAQLARELGTSPRAIGNANARNPVCLIVPCHRVIGTGGALTGFAFGTALKSVLLTFESGGGAVGA